MYKILIKLNSSKELYQWYMVEDEAYSTDDLTELATTYRQLLDVYPATSIMPIHVLDTDILITITE